MATKPRQRGLFDPSDEERAEGWQRAIENSHAGMWAVHFRHAAAAVGARALLQWSAPCIAADCDRRRKALPRCPTYSADLYCGAWRQFKERSQS